MIALAMLLLAQEAPGYSSGPFNLIVRWGDSSPIAIRYDNRARCEIAALEVVVQGDAISHSVGPDGKAKPADPHVRGPNAPYAFCIPG